MDLKDSLENLWKSAQEFKKNYDEYSTRCSILKSEVENLTNRKILAQESLETEKKKVEDSLDFVKKGISDREAQSREMFLKAQKALADAELVLREAKIKENRASEVLHKAEEKSKQIDAKEQYHNNLLEGINDLQTKLASLK